MKPQLSLEAFADWAEKQPADAKYFPGNAHECACCQYLKANGYPHARVDNTYWQPDYKSDPDHEEPLDSRINDAVYGKRESIYWTFGALAARLRAAPSLGMAREKGEQS